MTFTTAKQKLPKCFQDKIAIDKQIDDMRQSDVIDFKAGKKLVLTQQTMRYRCQQYIKKQRGDGNTA